MGKLYGHRTVASGKKFALLEEYSPLENAMAESAENYGIGLI